MLTREDIFEVYLEPKKDDEEEDAEVSSMTHRERAFYSISGQGWSWLQMEAAYQRWAGDRRSP